MTDFHDDGIFTEKNYRRPFFFKSVIGITFRRPKRHLRVDLNLKWFLTPPTGRAQSLHGNLCSEFRVHLATKITFCRLRQFCQATSVGTPSGKRCKKHACCLNTHQLGFQFPRKKTISKMALWPATLRCCQDSSSQSEDSSRNVRNVNFLRNHRISFLLKCLDSMCMPCPAEISIKRHLIC